MSEAEVRYYNRSEIPDQGAIRYSINVRSNIIYLLTLLIALFFFYVHSTLTIILGILSLGIIIVSFFYVKDSIVVELYDKSIICYDPVDHNKARCIAYDDIKEWDIIQDENELQLKLNDDTIFNQFCPRNLKLEQCMNKIIPDKRHRNVVEKISSDLQKHAEERKKNKQ